MKHPDIDIPFRVMFTGAAGTAIGIIFESPNIVKVSLTVIVVGALLGIMFIGQ